MPPKKKNQQPNNFGALGRAADALLTRASKAGVRRTAFLASAVALAFGFLVYWQYLLPMTDTMTELRRSNAAQNKQIAIARTVQETRPAFIEQYRKAKEVYEELRDLLPDDTKLSEVMTAIQSIAKRNNTRLTLFDALTPDVKSNIQVAGAQPSAPPEAPPPDGSQPEEQTAPQTKTVLNERVIPAQLIGSHASIMKFLREVASYELIIDTRDISITSLNKQENVNLRLVAFDAPPSAALPPDPPELRQQTTTPPPQRSAKLVNADQ